MSCSIKYVTSHSKKCFPPKRSDSLSLNLPLSSHPTISALCLLSPSSPKLLLGNQPKSAFQRLPHPMSAVSAVLVTFSVLQNLLNVVIVQSNMLYVLLVLFPSSDIVTSHITSLFYTERQSDRICKSF